MQCRRCAPGEHLPPPRPCEPVYPETPPENEVCPTPCMRHARRVRLFELLMLGALAVSLVVGAVRGTLSAPRAPDWAWTVLIVAVVWLAYGLMLAVRKLAHTDTVAPLLDVQPWTGIALAFAHVGVYTHTFVLAVAASAVLVLPVYRLYSRTCYKPSWEVYLGYIAAHAYLLGTLLFVAVVFAPSEAWRAGLLGLAAWTAFDLYTYTLPLPLVLGVSTLPRLSTPETVLLVLLSVLLVRAIWVRLYASGRNLFVFPHATRKK